MAPCKDKRTIKFLITETDRHEKGFTVYKITSVISCKSTPDAVSKLSIWKRYNDLKKLHRALKPLYASANIKEPYPSFPKPKFFGRFEAEVIEERRSCALDFLEFIARHSALFTSDVFVAFFENNELGKDFIGCSNSDTSEDERTNFAIPCTKETKNKSPLFSRTFFKGKSHKKSKSKAKIGEDAESCSNVDAAPGRNGLGDEASVGLHDGSDLSNAEQNSAQYVLIAAAHMSAAFRHEAIAEYEEAFTQYKLGISHLLNGVQTDLDVERRAMIQEKITKYLKRAERLYNRHLNCNISALNKPVSELQNYKVFKVMGSMMLVKDTLRGFTRVIKSVQKRVGCVGNINDYALRGKVPYMVQLYGWVQTETTVFLILQYISNGKLWDYLESHYKVSKNDGGKKGHTRSSSCDAAIQFSSDVSRNLECMKAPGSTSDVSYMTICEKYSTTLQNFASMDEDMSTMQLLENAQKLLQSINATLNQSDPIAGCMDPQNDDAIHHRIPAMNYDCDYYVDECDGVKRIEDDYDLCELSVTESLTDQNAIEDKVETDDKSSVDSFTEFTESRFPCAENENLYFDQSPRGEHCVDSDPPRWLIPESKVSLWAAEIICALEALHQQDVVVSDLRPDNILIDEDEHVSMTYIVRCSQSDLLKRQSCYISPEWSMFTPPITRTATADIWSFGVLIYELLTGYNFQQIHPGEFHSHSIVYIPGRLSKNAESLLRSILKYQPNERLTIPEMKQHSFFAKIDWFNLLSS